MKRSSGSPGNGFWSLKQGLFFLLAAFLFIFLAGGCAAKKQPAAGPVTEKAVPVRTAKAERGTLENAPVVSGKLEPWQSANIVAKVPGKVAAVHVDVGSAVRAGDVLVTLENTDLAARVEQARAGVAAAESALANASSALAAAEAAFQVAEANFQRGKQLLEQGAIPPAVFEAEYELKYKQAQEQLNQAKEQAEHGLPAQLAQARANLVLAETAYNDSLIRAPISGVVTARNINPGEMASSAAPVISLANLEKVLVKAPVAESLVNRLKEGQKVRVKVRAAGEQPFEGVITSIAPSADPVSKAFPVKVQLENPRQVLKPGMFAEVQFTAGQQEALLVPREAVVGDGEKSFVWVVKDGRATKKEVKTGDSDGARIAVTEGIAEGEEVVVAGQENLQEGAAVNVAAAVEK
jgi:cobalt-zinc-cadmium efflux system membrane fusion protein